MAKKKQSADPAKRIVSLTARVPLKKYEKLVLLRARTNREMLDLLAEAIDLLLEKHS